MAGVQSPVLGTFGGGSLGGATTDHNADGTAVTSTNGTVTLTRTGDLTFVPTAGYSGTYNFLLHAHRPGRRHLHG